MSQSTPILDAITGSAQTPSHFDHIDMSYRLRIRAFVGICMPPIFMSLNEHFKMMDLRKKGIASIMFYLDFTNGATPIAFGRRLNTEHNLKLYRSITDRDNRPAREGTHRLMLVSHSRIMAKARTHGHESLGFDDGTGAAIEAGTAQIMHVLTRPVGAPRERQITAVPEEFGRMREHTWEAPLPSVEGLSVPPAGYEPLDAGATQTYTDVWGLPNTDINQHVNVLEYVMGGENQFSRMLFAAGLPVSTHRIARARLLFRKPFFPGEAYAIRAKLYRRADVTQMQAGFHLLENGKPAPRPSSFVVFDGAVEQ